MRLFCFYILIVTMSSSCQSQKSKIYTDVGGPCEGCEAIHEYGDIPISAIDTLPDFAQRDPKIKIYGTVYAADGTTPTPGVLLYVYHTNRSGVYPTKGDEKAWAKRHGYIRGWLKTDNHGQYAFYTFRPASYPNSVEPEHIHLTVKEADKNAYYLDEFVFDDDPLLTPSERQELLNRGGSGIISLSNNGDILEARRDIVLGHNIPNYP